MQSDRQKKVQEEIRKLTGEFIASESNRNSLITPTSVSLSPDFKNCTIFVTVFPESYEENALSFLKRQRSLFKTFAKRKMNLRVIPFFDFKIDNGEKNRQLIDEISSNQ